MLTVISRSSDQWPIWGANIKISTASLSSQQLLLSLGHFSCLSLGGSGGCWVGGSCCRDACLALLGNTLNLIRKLRKTAAFVSPHWKSVSMFVCLFTGTGEWRLAGFHFYFYCRAQLDYWGKHKTLPTSCLEVWLEELRSVQAWWGRAGLAGCFPTSSAQLWPVVEWEAIKILRTSSDLEASLRLT